MAIQAAKSSKHIVLEKPVALNMVQARAVSEAVTTAGVQCCVILQNRLNPSIVQAKQFISDGSLGTMLV
jgi:UDP-N-acetyl-2-amino-2-deoxyglucuronate dehydrogenase